VINVANFEVSTVPVRNLSHDPILPVRNDVIGEVVMVEKWQAHMAKVNPTWEYDFDSHVCMLDIMLGYEADQRSATVAASFIRWLGTNCGRAFLCEAARLRDSVADDCVLVAWARGNKREHGRRLIEHILKTSRNDLRLAHMLNVHGNVAMPPVLTIRDYEVIELIAEALGSDMGRRFLEDCEAEIQRRVKNERIECRARQMAILNGR
jgi:hypothetical protein